MIINITNKEIANYLGVCPEYITTIKKTKGLSKIRVEKLKEFYIQKIKELQVFIDK